jgi:hypothetical protein
MGLLPKRRYRARFTYHHHLTGYGTDMRPHGKTYMKKYLSLLFLGSLAFSQSGCAFLKDGKVDLDYKPAERSKYIEAFFSNIDWNVIEQRIPQRQS